MDIDKRNNISDIGFESIIENKMIKEKLTQYIEDTIKENWDINAFADYGKDRIIKYSDVAKNILIMHNIFKRSSIYKGDKMNKPKGGGNRLNRINEELKREISNIINYEVTNSNVTGMVSVTSVKISPDLRYAKVKVSILNSRNVKQTLAGLKSSSGFIRSRIAQSVNLRVTPELVFELDDSMEYGERIDTILKDIMKDIKPNE